MEILSRVQFRSPDWLSTRIHEGLTRYLKLFFNRIILILNSNQGPVFPDSNGQLEISQIIVFVVSLSLSLSLSLAVSVSPKSPQRNTVTSRLTKPCKQDLFRSRDWLSANQGPVFPDSVSS
eukprot:sb/3476091/